VLTREKLDAFTKTHADLRRRRPKAEKEIEDALGKAEPPNMNVASPEKSKERIFLESLRQQVYEQYRPAFNEVTAILEQGNRRRKDLADVASPTRQTGFSTMCVWRTQSVMSPSKRYLYTVPTNAAS
jgi:hypothetical protein